MRLPKKNLKKLFHLPSPVELGRSDYNALPMDFFSDPGDYTWESWHQEMKVKYPIKYFLTETLTLWWTVHITMQLEHAWYWLKSHTYRKYHLLDLRQPDTHTQDDYRWGWQDKDRMMLYACFNLLVSFVEEEMGGTQKFLEHIKWLQEESPEGNWAQTYSEMWDLYHYWTALRKASAMELDEVRDDWHQTRQVEGKCPLEEIKFARLQEMERAFKEEETRNLIRLIKIRESMWS